MQSRAPIKMDVMYISNCIQLQKPSSFDNKSPLAMLHLTEHDERKIKTQKTCIELTLLCFRFILFNFLASFILLHDVKNHFELKVLLGATKSDDF